MGLKNLYDAKPVALHVLGRKAEGDLQRPFKTEGMFGGESCFCSSWVHGSILGHEICLRIADVRYYDRPVAEFCVGVVKVRKRPVSRMRYCPCYQGPCTSCYFS
jgi:hypothetical protein